MTNWIVLAGKSVESAPENAIPDNPQYRISGVRHYLSAPRDYAGKHLKIINLADSYSYQSRGYYASLLAGARGHKVLPSIETINDLSDPKLYANALPELEDLLNRLIRGSKEVEALNPGPGLTVFFGRIGEPRLDRFAKLLFDWFRAPALRVNLEAGEWWRIRSISLVGLSRLKPEEREEFFDGLARYTARQWRDAKPQIHAKYSLAILHDPNEALPPSKVASLKHFARVAAKLGMDADPITRKDLAKVANYDALFIRETTSIANHTYRFARRAQQEGMPVIDDPVSMIRCTNKVYLHELMGQAGITMPPSRILSSAADLDEVAEAIGFPIVVKIPDGSFSRGVKKAANPAEFDALATSWLKETDLLIAQKFMPTEFDWRVGILDGEPLFVCQYTMAKNHWQIVHHRDGARSLEGGFRPVRLADAPERLLDIAARAAQMIGDGLYGVDIKQTPDGYYLIEINDNPNLEHSVEDACEKDEVWTRLAQWFIRRIEA